MGFNTFPRNENKWGRTDWSRPSFTTVKQEPIETKESKPSQPRFSVFGKKAKFTQINKEEQEAKPIEKTTYKKNTFQLHLSTKSSANHKFQEFNQSLPVKKKRQCVQFEPICLERVCLFLETQPPIELKEAHDKQLTNPSFRIKCPCWPHPETSDYYDQKVVILNKKHFSIVDNKYIKGKVMVRNLALDKAVLIRYTFDHWTTVLDVDGVFFGPNPKNITFDMFDFTLDLTQGQLADHGELRGKIEFSIRYTAGHMDYYDNNEGHSYQIKVICDPLNDPWATVKEPESEHEEEQEQTHPEDDEEEDDDDDDDEEEEIEKHNHFANALKDYKHDTSFHLKRRQLWLSARYDFSQSLSLAKQSSHHDTVSFVGAKDYFSTKPVYIPSDLPSPKPSPTMSSASLPKGDMDFNSNYYMELLNKYCFYNSEKDVQLSINNI
ncbi:hypothetical protein CU098_009373 [Rhizopus stolonifer]|uniref:CBM21 domain-containing protein n=1 Tax=Rhizopus stolonifer TaxID=4846 RepID=A0A367JLC4_RHIST|nr:hypothetical protein CU098_009373 [Rhizopus stolonifer]